MIQEFVDQFMKNKDHLKARFQQAHVQAYSELVKMVIETIVLDMDEWYRPDPERIHEINDGDYQGTLVYVIGAIGYQPALYWYVTLSYGSCSGCDTLQAIYGYSSEPPTEQEVEDYMMLALHLVEGLKAME